MTSLAAFAERHPRQASQFKERWQPRLEALVDDQDPIPSAALREGYYAGNDLDYWMSGAIDALKAIDAMTAGSLVLPRAPAVLDFGCSSGRVLRHLARLIQPDGRAWGIDLNVEALDWMRRSLTVPITLFSCGHSPALPLDDELFDAVTAFSVFTHLDRDEEAWLLELRRVLKPGGLLYLTTLGSGVWREIGPDHVLMQNLGTHPQFASQVFGGAMPSPRLSFGFDESNPYSYTVFRSRACVEEHWAPHFSRFEYKEQYHDFQDVCLLWR
jgi:ubiquinone/menaquinone biosynthesis C-methylase UbiE